MANDDAIVDLVTQLAPPLEARSGDELLRANPDGIEVFFQESPPIRVLPGAVPGGILEILDQLRQMGLPAFIELEPATRTIVRFLIPLVTTVSALAEAAEGLRVTLDASHAVHVLDRSTADFDELRATLDGAVGTSQTLVVTETDDHRIIDARPWPQQPFPPKVPVIPAPRWWWRLWEWLRRRVHCWIWCVSPNHAQQLFDHMNSQTCDPLAVPVPCIPFLYPDDGCWARAHEMCRLLLLHGGRPRKIWIDGWLHPATRNHPSCTVTWGWHVAPTLCVYTRWRWWLLGVKDMVIDPSLFNAPVSLSTWKAAQGDPNAVLTPSDASLYWRNYLPADPAYVDTNQRLAYYRLQLKNRSLQPAGPPPYAHCP